jgi:hypothetical protein
MQVAAETVALGYANLTRVETQKNLKLRFDINDRIPVPARDASQNPNRSAPQEVSQSGGLDCAGKSFVKMRQPAPNELSSGAKELLRK